MIQWNYTIVYPVVSGRNDGGNTAVPDLFLFCISTIVSPVDNRINNGIIALNYTLVSPVV